MEKDYRWILRAPEGLVVLSVSRMPMTRIYDLAMLKEAVNDRKKEYKNDPSDVNKMFVERYEEGLALLEGRDI